MNCSMVFVGSDGNTFRLFSFNIFYIYQALCTFLIKHSFCPPVSLSVVPHPVFLISGLSLRFGDVDVFFLQSNILCSYTHLLSSERNPSSDHFLTGALVPSSAHCRTETVLPPSDHYCIETVAPSGDHYCIDIVLPSRDHCCNESIPPSSEHYRTPKVGPPSDHLLTKRT